MNLVIMCGVTVAMLTWFLPQGQEGSIQGYESTSEIDEEHVPSAEYLPQTALVRNFTSCIIEPGHNLSSLAFRLF